MRSKHLIVPMLLMFAACKGSTSESKQASVKTEQARPTTQTQPPVLPAPEEVLPADFPLPDSPTKQLVRAQKRLTMFVWEYALPDLSAGDAKKQIEDAMRAKAWTIAESDADHITATAGGRMYAVAFAPAQPGSTLAIRSFPESGPTTLTAPTSYPTKFPFLAGGTASNGPDGSKLTIAYQSDARDIELAMIVAAESGGWKCTGAGRVTCTKDKANVTFSTEPARGGSLLVVSAL
jgi:hypothetical protein